MVFSCAPLVFCSFVLTVLGLICSPCHFTLLEGGHPCDFWFKMLWIILVNFYLCMMNLCGPCIIWPDSCPCVCINHSLNVFWIMTYQLLCKAKIQPCIKCISRNESRESVLSWLTVIWLDVLWFGKWKCCCWSFWQMLTTLICKKCSSIYISCFHGTWAVSHPVTDQTLPA